MNWKSIDSENVLTEIVNASFQKPQVIFKHSTRCSVSSMAKNRIERNSNAASEPFYLLDLIAHRSLSNKISEDFEVYHESPQVLVISKGECIFDASHMAIDLAEIKEQLELQAS